jgi:hypothetical protein
MKYQWKKDYEVGACAIESWILGFLRRDFVSQVRVTASLPSRPMSPDVIEIKGYVDEYQVRS